MFYLLYNVFFTDNYRVSYNGPKKRCEMLLAALAF